MIGWIPERSEHAVRMALREVAPDLARGSVTLRPWLEQVDPRWSAGSATVDGRYHVKFAWSAPAALRVWHEVQVLDALAPRADALGVPRVVHRCRDPVLLVTDLVAGEALTPSLLSAASRAAHERIARELASFLRGLHDPSTLRLLDPLSPLEVPVPQATTDTIRAGLPAWVDPDRCAAVLRWCEWVDDQLQPPERLALVHGDFHGHNQLWDARTNSLRLVVDLEQSGPHEPEFDFRCVPSLGAGPEFLRAAVDAYVDQGGQPLDVGRIMAWHVRTELGDALWRSDAGVSLPTGGTVSASVDDVGERLRALGVSPDST